MIHETKWLLSISFILLAFSACRPAVQPDEDNQSTQQPEDTPIETITNSQILKTIPPPSLTPQPTKEPRMTVEPTNDPTKQPTEQPVSGPTFTPATEPPNPSSSLQLFPPAVQNWIDQAKEDLAQRQAVSTAEIDLVSYESKVWSDAGLGCPQPGMNYAQVPVEGYLITLGVDDLSYNYHGDGINPPFLCEQIPQTIKKPPPISLKATPTISVPPPRD